MKVIFTILAPDDIFSNTFYVIHTRDKMENGTVQRMFHKDFKHRGNNHMKLPQHAQQPYFVIKLRLGYGGRSVS